MCDDCGSPESPGDPMGWSHYLVSHDDGTDANDDPHRFLQKHHSATAALAAASATITMGSIRRKMSTSNLERELQLHEKDIDETLHDTALQHIQMKAVEKKDFTHEVRGTRDINNFLQKSEVLLDLAESDLESIVDSLLAAMVIYISYTSVV